MIVMNRLIWKLIALISSPAMNISELIEESFSSVADSTLAVVIVESSLLVGCSSGFSFSSRLP